LSSGVAGDGRRRDWIVARHHDRLDAHGAQRREPVLDIRLNDVLEMNDAEQLFILGYGERRAARTRNALDCPCEVLGRLIPAQPCLP